MHFRYYSFALLFTALLLSISSIAQTKYTLSGKVQDAASGEDLIGASVYVKDQNTGTVTNKYGFYSLTLPEGTYQVQIDFLGYTIEQQEVVLDRDRRLNIELSEHVYETEGVTITAEREDANVSDVQMSREKVNIAQIKKLPALFGEVDIIKNVQMLPGVVSAGEGSSAFFVRGGAADQNLILYDEAPVYDASHLFGLFSVFNADIVKSSELYKGGIPARYGGRLSSILEVNSRDGNNRRLAGGASLGLLNVKAYVEGPIQKGKSSFLLAGRRSYVGYYLKLAPDEETRNNNVYFYDVNAKLNFNLNENNRLYVSAYLGRDVFKFGDDFQFSWGNTTSTVRWNHVFNSKLFSNTSLVFSRFDYELELTDPSMGFNWTSDLNVFTLKEDLTYFISPKSTLTFGGASIYRTFNPGVFGPTNERSIFKTTKLQEFYAWDNALYVGNQQVVTNRLLLEYGLRLSMFSNIGPGTIYEYADRRNNVQIRRTDSAEYGRFETIKTFINPEPRFSARYTLDSRSSIKLSYNRMFQYIHQMASGTVPLPLSTWMPSSPYIDPQRADQVAAGYFRNLSNNTWEVSGEVYYKYIDNIMDYADNAVVFFNHDLVTELRPGTSESYGLETQVKKTTGKLTGYVAYTLSKTTRTIPGVNQGNPFPASYDRRHNISSVATFALNDRVTFGANFVYGTGRPITLPSGVYSFGGQTINEFTSRNGYRLPDFHRLDLSLTLEQRKKEGRKWQGEWSFAIYNVYSRKNPFTVFTQLKEDKDGVPIQGNEQEAKMIYLFPILPSISYNITF